MSEPDQGRRIEWGNVPQWVSAVCALILSGLAIWGIFFSPASQALVGYLQSELKIRNERIAALEKKEGELHLSIKNSETKLSELVQQREEFGRQVAALSNKSAELNRTIEFNLVREKLAVRQASIIGQLYIVLTNRNNEKPQRVRVFDLFVKDFESHAASLLESERVIARGVVESFRRQCARFVNIVVSTQEEFEKNFKVVQTVEECFKSVTP